MAEASISRGSGMSTEFDGQSAGKSPIILFNRSMPICIEEGLTLASALKMSSKEAVGGGVAGGLSSVAAVT